MLFRYYVVWNLNCKWAMHSVGDTTSNCWGKGASLHSKSHEQSATTLAMGKKPFVRNLQK